MITAYIHKAMSKARYEQLDDGTYYGEIPECPGVWANERTFEECQAVLQEVLEGWLVFKLWDRDRDIPVIDGIRLEVKETKGDVNHSMRSSSWGPTTSVP